jgi:serine/threonine protein kinase
MLEQGQVIGERYTIRELIAVGGFAAVYRAYDSIHDRVVALKQRHPGLGGLEPETIARFAREGDALRLVNHPNIVTIFDTVHEGDNSYVVMEYVAGGDLAGFIGKYQQKAEPIPMSHILSIGCQLADALTYAHSLQIIHRDIKPANVLMTADHAPRLSDFGMARLADSIQLTQSGVMIGTLGYLCPEAIYGDALDHRADIWSFGILLYEMITLQRPFEAPNVGAVLTSIVNKEPIPLDVLRPDVPPKLRDAIHSMLHKDRDQRTQNIRDVWETLQTVER